MAWDHTVAKETWKSKRCSTSSHLRESSCGGGKQRWLSWLHIVSVRSVEQICLHGATSKLRKLLSDQVPLLNLRPWLHPLGTLQHCVEVPPGGGCMLAQSCWSQMHFLVHFIWLWIWIPLWFPLLLCCRSWGWAANLVVETVRGDGGRILCINYSLAWLGNSDYYYVSWLMNHCFYR